MNKAYISENWNSGIFLADSYLLTFINGYRIKNAVGIFLLGHAIELYVKCLYWKIKGHHKEKNTHNIKKILEELVHYDNSLQGIIDDINTLNIEQLNLIYNGHLSDLKYLNMNHNNISKKDIKEYAITLETVIIFFSHLYIIFNSLERNEVNLRSLIDAIKENDKKIENGKFYIADAEIFLCLKMILNPEYKYKIVKSFWGEVHW